MKKIFPFLIVLTFCLALFPAPAAAQPSPAPLMDENSFTFLELRERELRLFGPFDTKSILFGLPANWRLIEGAELQLDMTVAIQTAAPQADGGASVYGGTLTVLLNRTVVAIIPLNQSGMSTSAVALPLQTLSSLRRDGRIELTFVLSSSEACLVDQKMDVTIHPSSRFSIPHEVIPPSTNLALFPRPLYQDSIFTDSALIVIPDQPTAAELQAALTTAAGLQARTGNSMQIEVAAATGLTQEKLAASHLILVGNAASLPILYQLVLPMSVTDGGFAAAGDAGVLQMIVSPWSAQRVVL
ncbi:MAG: cellulose biosynthesis cyclic di-GMP-binding regulatory protein BcsB, partial [Chloroflexi bacterium]|nr:cellulose biosynthesis cyclic di-GMP-binding regulatory protein BcsB [Chloroflexota bacterium]